MDSKNGPRGTSGTGTGRHTDVIGLVIAFVLLIEHHTLHTRGKILVENDSSKNLMKRQSRLYPPRSDEFF